MRVRVTVAVVVTVTPALVARHLLPPLRGDFYFCMNKKTLIISTIVLIVLIVLIVGGLFVEFFTGFAPWPISTTPTKITRAMKPYNLLVKNNPTFVQADYLRATVGDYAGAIDLYKKALVNVSDPEQEAAILTRMAQSYAAEGQYADSVQVYKGIIANQVRYPALNRAQAAENMADEYFAYSGNSAITSEIFKDEPFKSMYVSGDDFLSYRHLYEYTASIYPLATAELNIANWYAFTIDAMPVSEQKGATSTAYMAIIKKNFDAANKDGPRLLETVLPTESFHALILRATVLGRLSIAGDESLGEPENAFKYAISKYLQINQVHRDGRVRLQYAIFLDSKYGASRATDIQAILAPLYNDPTDIKRAHSIDMFLKTGQQGIRKQQYIALAGIDSKFKALLISVGWPSTDFK